MFGHCVSVYFRDALDKHAAALKEIGANVNYGLADVLAKLDRLPAGKKAEIEADIAAVYDKRPALAMVNARRGITNLHVPNDIIIDASMPNVVRDGGRMWNKNDELQDTIAMVPDRCYATMYKEILENAKQHGQFDPTTMGNVSNVGFDWPRKPKSTARTTRPLKPRPTGLFALWTRPGAACWSSPSKSAISSE